MCCNLKVSLHLTWALGTSTHTKKEPVKSSKPPDGYILLPSQGPFDPFSHVRAGDVEQLEKMSTQMTLVEMGQGWRLCHQGLECPWSVMHCCCPPLIRLH